MAPPLCVARFLPRVLCRWLTFVAVALAATLSNTAYAQSIAAGSALWTSQGCNGCHSATPDLRRRGMGNSVGVLNAAISTNAGGIMGSFAALTVTERSSLALYVGSIFTGTQNAVVAYSGSVNISLNDLVTTSTGYSAPIVINNVATVAAPTRGTLGAYVTNGAFNTTPTVNYTHTATNCTSDTLTFRGTGASGSVTTNRTVNITVTAPTPPTAGNNTNNIAYSTSPTALTLALGGGTATSVTVGALSGGTGSLSVVGTTVSYTASASAYVASQTFTYQAVGPCATSASGTITLNVAAPPAPVISSSLVASGTGGQAFNYQITASNVPTTFNATSLPAGLSVNAAGLISGTPTVSGNFMIPISAGNAAGTDMKTLSLTIGLVAPVITSANTVGGTSGSPFSFQVTASNLPTTFGATGLPSGLSINAGTGLITGTPVVAMGGAVPVMLTAMNAAGTGMQTLTINMALSAPTFTSANTASGNSGQAFSFQLTATDFPTAWTATGLPPGLSINTSTGLISGTATVAMTTMFNVMVTAMNGAGTTPQALTITITLAAPVISSPTTASGVISDPFSYQIAASSSPTSYSAPGLPAGLSINTGTGLISGTPTALGVTAVTISATNASGTAMQTLTITISNQAAPTATAFTLSVPFNAPATYDLVASIQGNYTSVAIASQPSHGTVVLNGFGITYTPVTGYFGPDTFTFTVTGPGGTSQPAKANIQVGVPGAPVVAAKAATVSFGTATAIDLSGSITGVATSVTVTVQPQHGTITVNGKVVTYTPNAGYYGDDLFTYVAVGPGGTSMPADVTITIPPLGPSADTVNFILPLNTPTTLDLTPFVKGTSITGVVVTGAPKYGTVTVNGMKVTYTPKQDFFGADTFTYSAFGVVGKSAAATVRVTVVGRPDPAKDANVTGLLAAQNDSAKRFADAQIANYQSRLESLHRSGDSGASSPPGSAPTPIPTQTARATSQPAGAFEPIKPTDGSRDATGKPSAFLPTSYAGPVPAGTTFPFTNELTSLLTSKSLNVASLVAASSGGGTNDGTVGTSGYGPLSFWVSGVANFGKRVATSERGQLDFTTDGISAGVDRRFSSKLAAGVGVGFARDRTEIGTDGSRSRARSASVAVYSSYHPTQNTFVDGLIGVGTLDFKTQRYVTPIDAFASGDRKGSQLFASLAGGYEYRSKGFLLSPYLRLDYTSDKLKQSTESGAGQYALTYFSQTTPSLQAVAGLRAESLAQTNYGWATPRARIEYRRELQGDRDASLAYADLTGGPRFAFSTGAVVRNSLLVGIGADFIRKGGLTIGLDYQLQHNFSKDSIQGIRLNFTQDLDALGSPYALRGFFSIPQKPEKIQFDAGFMFDSNVPRAKEQSDKRSDRAYSVNVGKGFQFKFEDRENIRATVTLTLGGEKFQRFDGLSRAMAGAEGEVQYRTSGEFDAITFAAFGRVSAERYRSSLRDGYRYSAGITARRSLTDRIDVFAALAHNERVGDSAVFNSRDNSARLNFDYSLSERETLYATGEYRRGQVFSSGHASLDNLDVAEVFVLDDAYPGANFFAYRFDANTVISTLGYNLGFGPKHSLDLSWRRAKSTPRLQSGASSGTSSYVADQYSIIYLIRF